MTPQVPEDTNRYGCPVCWPSSDATAAWIATGRLRFEVEVSDSSHFHERILVCDACSQKFLRAFYEEVDFEDGDDPQFLVVVPITPAEEDTLLFRDDGAGSQIRRAVGYVEVNDARESSVGSGFLISPTLFITNCHVMSDVQAAQSAQVTFDREMGVDGKPQRTTTYLFAPDVLALFSPQNELDYALVALGTRHGGDAALADLGYCPLSNSPDRHRLGMNVNIIQHPNGFPKMLSLRNNLLTARGRDGRTLLYETDTEQGSSGAPVFNDTWDVVALHHWGEPFLEKIDEDGNPIPGNVNEGVRISAIYEHLSGRLAGLPPGQRAPCP